MQTRSATAAPSVAISGTDKQQHDAASAATVVGWDIGGAHLKAARLVNGRVVDAAEWPCPLWLGLHRLDAALEAARERWHPGAGGWPVSTRHAATMTGEGADFFASREEGVVRIAERLAAAVGTAVVFYGGEAGWIGTPGIAAHWRAIASMNWHASAAWAARGLDRPEALFVDIGSTTTDLVPLRDGWPRPAASGDAARLSTGELVYHGVVRTPLCALAPRVRFGGAFVNVMNELFATTADVYRLTGELNPAHDLHPAADGGAKDARSTRRRLARMIGRDEADADAASWHALARDWREAQLATIASELQRVAEAAGVGCEAALVAAGCGEFLVASLAKAAGRRCLRFADLAPLAGSFDDDADAAASALARRVQVSAPAVAVALLAASV